MRHKRTGAGRVAAEFRGEGQSRVAMHKKRCSRVANAADQYVAVRRVACGCLLRTNLPLTRNCAKIVRRDFATLLPSVCVRTVRTVPCIVHTMRRKIHITFLETRAFFYCVTRAASVIRLRRETQCSSRRWLCAFAAVDSTSERQCCNASAKEMIERRLAIQLGNVGEGAWVRDRG